MIEALGITMREAIEAIVVIFIISAYLERTGKAEKKKAVYIGAISAAVMSILLSAVLTLIGIKSKNELIEGIISIIAGALVASLIVWMWRKAKVIKKDVERKLKHTSSDFALGTIAFIMVLREGIETAVFLQGLLLSGTTPVENFLGGILGITLALIFGIVFLKGSTTINLSHFFKATSGILTVLVIKLFAGALHEFFEVGILSSNETILSIVEFMSKKSTGSAIIGLMLTAMMVMVIYDISRAKPPENKEINAAEKRKARYKLAREKNIKIILSSVILIIILILLTLAVFASNIETPDPVGLNNSFDQIEIKINKDWFL